MNQHDTSLAVPLATIGEIQTGIASAVHTTSAHIARPDCAEVGVLTVAARLGIANFGIDGAGDLAETDICRVGPYFGVTSILTAFCGTAASICG